MFDCTAVRRSGRPLVAIPSSRRTNRDRAGHTAMRTLLVVVMLLAGSAVQAADPLVPTWREVADGVHVGIREPSTRLPVAGNTTLVVGDAGVIVFDGGALPLWSERVVEKVRSLTDRPVTHIVVSHWHQDHSWGISELLKAFPGAEVIAHRNTRDTLAVRAEADEAGVRDLAPQMRDSLTGLLTQELAADRRLRVQQALIDIPVLDREWKRLTTTVPTRVFDQMLVLAQGARRIELLHLGLGNTDGDIVMWLPAERIVATGDLVVRPTPYGFGSYPTAWADTLRALKALGPALIVPGHGDLQRDTAYVDLLIETLQLVAVQMAPLVAQGLAQDEAAAKLDFSSVEPRFTGGDAQLTTLFDIWFKQPIAQAAWKVARGESPALPLTQDGA